MVGILVHGDNHFIVSGPRPSLKVARELAEHWSIIQIGGTTPPALERVANYYPGVPGKPGLGSGRAGTGRDVRGGDAVAGRVVGSGNCYPLLRVWDLTGRIAGDRKIGPALPALTRQLRFEGSQYQAGNIVVLPRQTDERIH